MRLKVEPERATCGGCRPVCIWRVRANAAASQKPPGVLGDSVGREAIVQGEAVAAARLAKREDLAAEEAASGAAAAARIAVIRRDLALCKGRAKALYICEEALAGHLAEPAPG